MVYAAEIIEKLNSNQMPARIIPPIDAFFKNIGGEMGFVSRMAIANQWLLKPLLIKSLSNSPASNALIRTTTAISMAKGSDAANVLTSVAEVTVNFRILPGSSVADVIRHVEDICEGYQVDLVVISEREPSTLSPEDVRAFQVVRETVEKIYPEAIVSPYISVVGTDSYKYQIVSDHIYRFMPLYLNQYEQHTIHNENEHISIDNYGKLVRYFKEIMETY
ncbi:MAG: M20/M25/M40 family metallo-hydrolase [Tannerellaceae bacterium]|nr:M20/M25/M40 family metallo-hydrolase [Tannerellaceae bacterium]